MQIKNIMSEQIISVAPDDKLRDVVQQMRDHDIGCVPVYDGEKVCGMITDRDVVLRCLGENRNPDDMSAAQIMTENPLSVSSEQDVEQAAKIMGEKQVKRLPVVDDGELVGMISMADIARMPQFDMEVAHALAELCMPEHTSHTLGA